MARTQFVKSSPPPYPPTTGYEPCAITDPELFFPERNNNFIKIAVFATVVKSPSIFPKPGSGGSLNEPISPDTLVL